MTASFRNGWVASLVLAALSSLVELVRTMRALAAGAEVGLFHARRVVWLLEVVGL